MGHLLTVMGHIGGILVAALSAQITDEFKAWIPWLTKRLIERSVSKLPASLKDRYREEWSRHIEDTPGQMGKLLTALNLLRASVAMRSELGRPKDQQQLKLLMRVEEITAELEQKLLVNETRLNVLTEIEVAELDQQAALCLQFKAEITALKVRMTAIEAEMTTLMEESILLAKEFKGRAT